MNIILSNNATLQRIVIGGFGLAVCVLLTGTGLLFSYLMSLNDSRTPVTVVVGGEAQVINTNMQTVTELLTHLNLQVDDGDQLSVDGDALIQSGMVITLERARHVIVTVNGQPRHVRTTLTNPADILTDLGLSVDPDDRVILDGTRTDPLALANWPVPVNQITIRRAIPVMIVSDENRQQIRTTGVNVGEALYEGGYTLYQADRVTPDTNTAVSAGMTITIDRSVPVTIVADGVTVETRTLADTVGGLLASQTISLMGLDYSIPSEDAPIQPNMTVRVMRVTETFITENELIPFGNQQQPDASLELDTIRLLNPGQNGLRQIISRVRYENDVEIERSVEADVITRDPQDRVVAYGTGVVLRPVQTEAGTREYWRKLRVLVTSYHPAALGGDNITATGQTLTKGIVGVDPTVIPYGTQMYVPGYGIGVAADTGGPRSTRLWIDLGYDDENFRPWSQYVDVYLLTPVPSNFPYILPD